MSAPSVDSDGFYSPGRVKLLLWRYDDLVRLTGSGTGDDSGSQRLPRETPEGGFEMGAAIQADLDWALSLLEPVVREVVWQYYVAGYPAVSVARHIPGCNRWFVDRARHRGIREMALRLHWKPPTHKMDGTAILEMSMEDEGQTQAELHERMRQIVARGLNVCPRRGPPGYACPVIDCRGFFDHTDGEHVGERIERAA